MNEQQRIDQMKNGNIAEIKRSISSDTPILVMNSLIFGAKNNVVDDNYIEKVKIMCSNDTVLMGFQISSVAKAVLSVLSGTKYSGDDLVTKSLIDNIYNI